MRWDTGCCTFLLHVAKPASFVFFYKANIMLMIHMRKTNKHGQQDTMIMFLSLDLLVLSVLQASSFKVDPFNLSSSAFLCKRVLWG